MCECRADIHKSLGLKDMLYPVRIIIRDKTVNTILCYFLALRLKDNLFILQLPQPLCFRPDPCGERSFACFSFAIVFFSCSSSSSSLTRKTFSTESLSRFTKNINTCTDGQWVLFCSCRLSPLPQFLCHRFLLASSSSPFICCMFAPYCHHKWPLSG